ncbi:MAG: nucleotide exchange factor GrpE [Bacteroidia bacterium]|nr:nucleotide exchange factor GrpE [Bacteroidia bacterium]
MEDKEKNTTTSTENTTNVNEPSTTNELQDPINTQNSNENSSDNLSNDSEVNTSSKEGETAESSSNNHSQQEIQELMKKIEALQQELNELNDKHIRLLAEFDNFRKRTRKEKEDLIKYAGEDIWKKILPVLDDFERAIKENQNTNDIDVVKKGFELIYNKFKHITTQNNLMAIDSMHKEFNADTMEAVAKVPAPSEEMKGKVIDELEKAYQLNDKLIRPAKVVVGE